MIKARYAKQIRAGIIFYELCQENALLIEYARMALAPLGYEAFLHHMIRDGHRPVTSTPIL
ncbi:hypothetical protein [Brevibacterium sp. CFH 10365]|uniref:hypothetical protein n=1 Tax=Brevibacterium sp. CFH 10365 TaxID=2585207 RepID=UPI0012668778|nr:hypothetical protein [Brevibacterium sp. CFH 10365]